MTARGRGASLFPVALALLGVTLIAGAVVDDPVIPGSLSDDADFFSLVALLGLVLVAASTLVRRRALRRLPARGQLEALLPGARRRERDGAVLLDARRDGAFVRVTSTPGDRTLSCRVAHRVHRSLAGRVGRIDGDLLYVAAGETGLRAPPVAYASPAAAAALEPLLELTPSIRVGEADLEVHVAGDRPDHVLVALDHLIALARALAPPVEVRVHASARPRLTCPYCHGALDDPERVDCAGCGTPHHAECFHEHGGCTVLGCEGERPTRSRVR